MPINCHVPITVRIVGVPSDEQLTALGETLARAIADRLAEAERVLTERHGGSGAPLFSLAALSVPAVDAGHGELTGGVVGEPGRAGVAFFDASGARRQEERAAVLRHGGDPDVPVPPQPDVLRDAAREAAAHPPESVNEPAADAVLPGDSDQQETAITDVDLEEVWRQQHIRDIFGGLAEHMAATELAKHHTGPSTEVANWLDYWHVRFTRSVHYILNVRPTHHHTDRKTRTRHDVPARTAHLLNLRDAEADVLASSPPATQSAEATAMWAVGVVLRVQELRRAAQAEWLDEIARAVGGYLVIAENEARFLSEEQNAQPVAVFGLPEELEGTIPASAFPTLFDQDAPGFSPAVARFMAALQRTSGQQVKAINYGGHEKGNPFVGDIDDIGKYSFDLAPDLPKDGNGFYQHDAVFRFFLAMEEASVATRIAWVALYNDFRVARDVNERIGRRRVGFSGGGGPANATPDQQGSFHHGPDPFILHIHVNIMPRDLAAQFFAGFVNPPPNLDLGDQP